MLICNQNADLHKNGAVQQIFIKNQVYQRINLNLTSAKYYKPAAKNSCAGITFILRPST